MGVDVTQLPQYQVLIKHCVNEIYGDQMQPTVNKVQERLRKGRIVPEIVVESALHLCAMDADTYRLLTDDAMETTIILRSRALHEAFVAYPYHAKSTEDEYGSAILSQLVAWLQQRALGEKGTVLNRLGLEAKTAQEPSHTFDSQNFAQANSDNTLAMSRNVHPQDHADSLIIPSGLLDMARACDQQAAVHRIPVRLELEVAMPPQAPSSNQAPKKNMSANELANITQKGVSTVMIRNIPRHVRQKVFLKELDDSGFVGKYDFAYLPFQFGKDENFGLGYAFVNFENVDTVCKFIKSWHGSKRFQMQSGDPALSVSAAKNQGKESNMKTWLNRGSRVRNPELRPFLREGATTEALLSTAAPGLHGNDIVK